MVSGLQQWPLSILLIQVLKPELNELAPQCVIALLKALLDPRTSF